jgi:putative oxidoreductase
MTASRLIARPLLASIFVAGPANALKNADGHAEKAKPVADRMVPVAQRLGQRVGVPVPTNPKTWVRINAGLQLAAALGLATGRAPRLSSAVLAGSLVPTTLAAHRFWEESDPATKNVQRIQFFKNLSLLGGLLIAAGDTDGKPGVAWRARHAAKDARRTARQETRLLKAKAHLG